MPPRPGVFDLLDRVDATGGLVFSLSPEPPIPSPTLRLITDSQIANEIDRIERTRNYWWDEDSHCRFSLGGAQGKFTLSRVDGKWYWPDMMLPSTHIVKPKPHDLPEATKVELATMRLSELCGIDTPARGEITAQRKTAYIVERFDRRLEEGRIVRLRQEDFLQALGLPTQDKYDPSAGRLPGSPAIAIERVGIPVLPVARKAGLQHVVRQQRRTCEELFPDPRSRIGDTPVSPV